MDPEDWSFQPVLSAQKAIALVEEDGGIWEAFAHLLRGTRADANAVLQQHGLPVGDRVEVHCGIGTRSVLTAAPGGLL